MLNIKQENCENQCFKSFGLTGRGSRIRFTNYEADSLITRPELESRSKFLRPRQEETLK